MDLESECSTLESVEDNEVTQESASLVDEKKIKDNHVDENKIKDNGSYAIESEKLPVVQTFDVKTLPSDNHETGVEAVQSVNSPPLGAKSPGGSSPALTKGYGLKKWKRIKRDFVKDGSPSVDNSKILKRASSGPLTPAKPVHSPAAEIKQNSEGSSGPVNVTSVTNANVVDVFTMSGSSLDSRIAVGTAFVGGTDSENSEDRSSKSSTAASAPKARYDLPAVLGYVREKNRMKNLVGKSAGNSTQGVQPGKGRVETSKKHRGERVKIEKENSHSSMESDSRSSNFVFMQGVHSVTSNGKQSGRSMNYEGENIDEALASNQQFSEEVQTSYRKENVGEIEELSQDAADSSWGAKEEKNENHRPSPEQDPLVESILALQSVQEALEKEVQKLGEVGKEPISLQEDSVNSSTEAKANEPKSSDQSTSETISKSASTSLETQVLTLIQKVNYLESQLVESRIALEMKESRIAELEASVTSTKSPKEESGSTAELRQEKCREMELEVEGLFRQKMEAEIEYLALTATIQKLKLATSDQRKLLEEQKLLAGEQTQMLNKLGEVENKAAMLKKQAEELESYRGDILDTEEVLEMQRRVCKVTSRFFIQLLLLLLVFWLVVLPLSPHSGAVVPT